MTFQGIWPYGGQNGAIAPADTAGDKNLIGGGEGADFYLTVNAPFTTRAITTFTDVGRILPSTGSGAIPISGGGVATIQVLKAGTVLDAGVSTLNYNPGSDNSFLPTDSPAGQINIALNYAGLGGLFGSVYQPARSDHSHETGGLISVSKVHPYSPSTTVTTGLTDIDSVTFGPGLNGIRYDIQGYWICQGGVTTGDQIDSYIALAGAASVIGMSTQTANGERVLVAYNHVDNVLGDGATVYSIHGKAQIKTSGQGTIQAGLLVAVMIPRS